MKKLILVRFTPAPIPNPAVSRALASHMMTTPRPQMFAMPGAIITLFATESDVNAVNDDLKRTNSMFVLADVQDAKVNLPQELTRIPEVAAFLGEAVVPTQRQARAWTLNELLDLINENGINSLTPEQKARLEELS